MNDFPLLDYWNQEMSDMANAKVQPMIEERGRLLDALTQSGIVLSRLIHLGVYDVSSIEKLLTKIDSLIGEKVK